VLDRCSVRPLPDRPSWTLRLDASAGEAAQGGATCAALCPRLLGVLASWASCFGRPPGRPISRHGWTAAGVVCRRGGYGEGLHGEHLAIGTGAASGVRRTGAHIPVPGPGPWGSRPALPVDTRSSAGGQVVARSWSRVTNCNQHKERNPAKWHECFWKMGGGGAIWIDPRDRPSLKRGAVHLGLSSQSLV
jgi:hypothetical protein